MRHYLNTTLKGKHDDLGLTYHSIYFMFTVNRQTFKIKSRILNKPYREDQFDAINTSDNIFIAKDKQIITRCIEQSINNGFLNIDRFKELYTKNCTSILNWLEDYIRNDRNSAMDDFFYGTDVDFSYSDQMSQLEQSFSTPKRELLHYLNQFSISPRAMNNFNKYTLIFDWNETNLKQEFENFLRQISDNERLDLRLIPFVDALISFM